MCTPYVGGHPTLPVHAGETQCRFLGTRVESWDADGRHGIDRIGELVVTAAIPSMPVEFWADPDGSRFQEAYFGVYPGIWRHGDWITITSRGTAIVHGRSDFTINRHGVRMGCADIYAAVDRIPEIADSLVIGAELDGGRYWMPLFVTLADGAELDDTGKRLEVPVKRLLHGFDSGPRRERRRRRQPRGARLVRPSRIGTPGVGIGGTR